MPPYSQLCDAAVLDKRQIAERLLALEQVEVQEGQNKAFILEAYRGALKTAPEPMDVQALRQPFPSRMHRKGNPVGRFRPTTAMTHIVGSPWSGEEISFYTTETIPQISSANPILTK